MKCEHIKYGIQRPQERNLLVMENIIRWTQETRKTSRREGSITKHWRKKAKTRASYSGAHERIVENTATEHPIYGSIN